MDAFIRWLLYVPRPGIEPTALVYAAHALTEIPGKGWSPDNFLIFIFLSSPENTLIGFREGERKAREKQELPPVRPHWGLNPATFPFT